MPDEDLLASPDAEDPCWCASGDKYVECHGAGPRFGPGALVPEKPPDEGGVWIAPDVQLTRAALEDLVRRLSGAPITMPTEEPRQRPLTVSALSAALALVDVEQSPLELAQIAVMRMDALDALGLGSDDETYLRKRLSDLNVPQRQELRGAVLHAAKATLDRLRVDASGTEPPTSLWTPNGDPRRLAGQTLLWADQYLVIDETFERMLRKPEAEWLPELAAPLAREARLRPMLEAGTVALVPEEVTNVLVMQMAHEATEKDLENEPLVEWMLSQYELSGPSELEVIFLAPRDGGHDLDQMFFLGHIEQGGPADDGTFLTSWLHQRYNPSRDYGPWIQQSIASAVGGQLQKLNLEMAAAQVLGGQLLVTSPFEGRLLARKGISSSPVQPLLWADVPSLPEADPGTLARIAAEDETVQALRRTVRRGMAAVSSADRQAAATAIADELREEARLLERAIRRDNRWKLAGPAVLGVAGVGLGALTGPLGAAAGLVGAAGSLLPVRADRAARREQAAYAVIIANRARDR